MALAHTAADEIVVRARGLRKAFGAQVVFDGLDLDIRHGEILGLVGASGSGKSVLLRCLIGLEPVASGRIEVFGRDAARLSERERIDMDTRWGVLFQDGALFGALTVRQNVEVPMRQHLRLSEPMMRALASIKIAMVGLPPDAADKFPSELSGGMRKRAGLARALALDPEILFLDEPTAGLDPIGAAAFDKLIRSLQQTLGLTVYMVTHDLDSLFAVCDRVAVLSEGRILRTGTPGELQRNPNQGWVQDYFQGERARAVRH